MINERTKEFVFYSEKLSYKTVMGSKGIEYIIEGYISTGDLDLVDDIVTKSCMKSMELQFDNRIIKIDFEHEAFRGKNKLDSEAAKSRIPLGKAIAKSRDSKGVLVKWKMNPNWKKFDQKGNVVMTFKEIWANIEDGMYDAFSIAYIPTRIKNIERDGKSIRLLDDVILLNVALTGNAINPYASMTAIMAKSLEFMKSIEGDDLNMEQIEIKNKREKKSYKEDGKHVHTSDVPMGEHNHPEIESEISNLWNRFYDLSDTMYKLRNMLNETTDKDVSETMIKSKKSNLLDVNVNKKNMRKKVVDKKDDKPVDKITGKDGNDESDVGTGDPGTGDAGVKDTAEDKSITLKELKSVVETLSKDVKALKQENADLKAIVEKPLQKAKGAEGAEQKNQGQDKPVMVGPLDLI